MQATSDIFLGWTRGPGGRDFYIRQLWDMKGSVDTTTLQPHRARRSTAGSAAGRWPGRMPAAAMRWRSRPTSARSDTFDGAIADFSETYADVNARDHAAYVAAIEAGRVSTPSA